jgi:hypothetical protein
MRRALAAVVLVAAWPVVWVVGLLDRAQMALEHDWEPK